jgi:hypothetical protein
MAEFQVRNPPGLNESTNGIIPRLNASSFPVSGVVSDHITVPAAASGCGAAAAAPSGCGGGGGGAGITFIGFVGRLKPAGFLFPPPPSICFILL